MWLKKRTPMSMRFQTIRAPGPRNQVGRSTGLFAEPKYLKTNSRTLGFSTNDLLVPNQIPGLLKLVEFCCFQVMVLSLLRRACCTLLNSVNSCALTATKSSTFLKAKKSKPEISQGRYSQIMFIRTGWHSPLTTAPQLSAVA